MGHLLFPHTPQCREKGRWTDRQTEMEWLKRAESTYQSEHNIETVDGWPVTRLQILPWGRQTGHHKQEVSFKSRPPGPLVKQVSVTNLGSTQPQAQLSPYRETGSAWKRSLQKGAESFYSQLETTGRLSYCLTHL